MTREYILPLTYGPCDCDSSAQLKQLSDDFGKFKGEHDRRVSELLAANNREVERRRAAERRLSELENILNSPAVSEWHQGVRIETAHQVARWGAGHDSGKSPEDWFWLLGYLGGKALHAAKSGDLDKAKHHTISSGAALCNWFRALERAPENGQ